MERNGGAVQSRIGIEKLFEGTAELAEDTEKRQHG